jgi:hypothetical protein
MSTEMPHSTAFDEFRAGKWPVYVIVGQKRNPGVPLFRKIDSQKIAIVAWKNEGTAEEFRSNNKLSNSSVIAVSYTDLTKFLDSLTPDQRRACMIELI